MVNIPKISNPYIGMIILTMGAANMGVTIAYPAFTISAISLKYGFTTAESDWFNICGYFAATAGCIIINFAVARFGKAWALFGSSLLSGISWILLGASVHKAMFFIFRILTGSVVGCCSSIVPAFLNEIAPPKQQFMFGFMTNIGIGIGFVYVTIIGVYLRYDIASYLSSIPILIAAGSLFIPESVVASEEPSPPIWDVFKHKREISIATALMFFLQFSGINAIASNLYVILSGADLTVSTDVIGIITNSVMCLTSIIAAFFVDKFSNKSCWLVSSAGQCIAFVLICLHQQLKWPTGVFIFALFLEQSTFGIGTGTVPFAESAAIFPAELCAQAMSVCTAFDWLFSAAITLIFPYMSRGIGLGYAFLFFAFIQLFAVIFGVFCLSFPEKKGEEADDKKEDASDDGANNL